MPLPPIAIRPMREADLAEADRVYRRAQSPSFDLLAATRKGIFH